MKSALIICLNFVLCVGFAQEAKKTENIVLITLDGLRWQELFTGADPVLIGDNHYVKDTAALKHQFWRTTPEQRRQLLMPFFWSIIANEGQLYGNRSMGNMVNCSNTHYFSYPGYSEILCGFSDDQRINSNDKLPNPNTTVLEFIHEKESFNGSVAAFGSWDVFPYIINEARSNIPVNAGFETSKGQNLSEREEFLNVLQSQIPSPWPTVRLDAFTHHYALEYLKRNHPRVTYIAYGETDDFAHEGHYDAYLKSAHRTDAFIKEIWEFVQSDSYYQGKTTMIITTDHGRGTVPKEDWQHHGNKIDRAGQIWIAVMGPDSPALGVVKDQKQYFQNQIAATLAKLLGFEYTNEHPVGESIEIAFIKP